LDGLAIDYEYDEAGRVIKESSSGGETTIKRYDDAGRLIREDYENGESYECKYNVAGQKIWERTPYGVEYRWVFDKEGVLEYVVKRNTFEDGSLITFSEA